MKEKRIYLVGNPNCGKSTLFNQLTGLKQKPETLVESQSKKEKAS